MGVPQPYTRSPRVTRAGMSYAENRKTVEDFVPGFRSTDGEMRVEHIISVYKETHRLVDNWPYYIDGYGIFVESDGKKTYVKDIVASEEYPESAEALVLEKLENWAKTNETGVAFWISPSYPGKYPVSKIIIHKIAYEFGSMRKIVLSSAILFDSDHSKILDLIQKNFPETSRHTLLETLRSELIVEHDLFDINKLITDLKKLDVNILNTKNNMSREDLYIHASYISSLVAGGASGRLVAYEMQRLGLLGQFSISCPPKTLNMQGVSFSEFAGIGIDLREEANLWHQGICRMCGTKTWVGGCDICEPCVRENFS